MACAVVRDKAVTLSNAVTRAVECVMLSDTDNPIADVTDWNILPSFWSGSNTEQDNHSRDKSNTKSVVSQS